MTEPRFIPKSRPVKLYSIAIVSNISKLDELELAKQYFEQKTGYKTSYCLSKTTKHTKNYDLRRGQRIGFKLILYGAHAYKFFNLFEYLRVYTRSIDKWGSLSVGVPEYHLCSLLPHNPDIPNFGFSISAIVSYNGYTAKYKKNEGMKLIVLKEDVVKYILTNIKNVTVT